MTIPKILFQTWKNKNLSEDFKKYSETWKKHNPDFEYRFYTDIDIYKFIYISYPQYIDLYENLATIEKIDMFRYLVIHYHGGVYIDIDTECINPIGPLLDLFENSIITGYEYNIPEQYLQWFIAAPKGCQTMIKLVEEIKWRSWFKLFKMLSLSNDQIVLWFTGPVMYTYILKKTNESVVVLDKGKLGSYDEKLTDRNSYLVHKFCGSWKYKLNILENNNDKLL